MSGVFGDQVEQDELELAGVEQTTTAAAGSAAAHWIAAEATAATMAAFPGVATDGEAAMAVVVGVRMFRESHCGSLISVLDALKIYLKK
ncbi:hypothetical protein Sbs19_04320 [Sphingobium sp. BS19]|nr:hypothetical protein Sbs19_04320 [Sphingobium sp. BS19]